MEIALRPNWYRIDLNGFDLQQPGVYEWRIEDGCIYIGKAKKLRRRIGHYPNNVRRLINGLPWHGNPLKNYRDIHYELHRAHGDGTPVLVTALQNCAEEERAERERFWIRQRWSEYEAGGLRVLNRRV